MEQPCQTCGTSVAEGAAACAVCGTPSAVVPASQMTPPPPSAQATPPPPSQMTPPPPSQVPPGPATPPPASPMTPPPASHAPPPSQVPPSQAMPPAWSAPSTGPIPASQQVPVAPTPGVIPASQMGGGVPPGSPPTQPIGPGWGGPEPVGAAPARSRSKAPLVAALVVGALLVAVLGFFGAQAVLVSDDDSETATDQGGGDVESSSDGDPAEVDLGSGDGNGNGQGSAVSCPANSSQPEIVRYWFDSAGWHVVIVIHTDCDQPQVLQDDDARFGLFSGDEAFAQGSFDLSGDPVFIPPQGTSGEIELIFDPANASLNTAALEQVSLPDSEATSVSEGFDLRYVFVCTPGVEDGAESGTASSVAGADLSDTGSASSDGQAGTVDDAQPFAVEAVPESLTGDAALAELNRIADLHAPYVQEFLYDRWVPQLSSKRLGITDPTTGELYDDYGDILDNYIELKTQYPSVRLIRSNDYASFSLDGFFVMVVGESYLSGEAAVGWCQASGRGFDDCFAKRITNTPQSDDNTEYQPR